MGHNPMQRTLNLSHRFTAARRAAPTTDSVKLRALLPLLSWLREPMATFWLL